MTKSEQSTGLGVVGVAGVDGATARWLPIECADKTITNVQDFSEIGIILCNSDRYWVRDDDGRVYEASWTDDKAGYWWDWEGESQVDPVQFMPHPLDPRFSSPSMTPTTHPATGEDDGWIKFPDEPPLELLKSINIDNQALVYEKGRYYNAWLEFEQSEGGWIWMDDGDSEPNPTHYRPLGSIALTTPEDQQ